MVPAQFEIQAREICHSGRQMYTIFTGWSRLKPRLELVHEWYNLGEWPGAGLNSDRVAHTPGRCVALRYAFPGFKNHNWCLVRYTLFRYTSFG